MSNLFICSDSCLWINKLISLKRSIRKFGLSPFLSHGQFRKNLDSKIGHCLAQLLFYLFYEVFIVTQFLGYIENVCI